MSDDAGRAGTRRRFARWAWFSAPSSYKEAIWETNSPLFAEAAAVSSRNRIVVKLKDGNIENKQPCFDFSSLAWKAIKGYAIGFFLCYFKGIPVPSRGGCALIALSILMFCSLPILSYAVDLINKGNLKK